ncbi:DUF1203 domain-containing protein, partial [Planktotalea sp.]|uniref:DUF1203 domain-containing protein n=1 Tax=Planktotalea sp. TaxID=2029877 RepID=UPI0032972F32
RRKRIASEHVLFHPERVIQEYFTMTPIFSGMPTVEAQAFRQGAKDVYGNPPEHQISSGVGVPCRHCLKIVPKGAGVLVLAYRPFDGLHPYAETGPIFLCADSCAAPEQDVLPDVLTASPQYLIKGYTEDQRIKYGTGAIVPKEEATTKIKELLQQSDLAFVDIRSASNNCWLMRAQRQS